MFRFGLVRGMGYVADDRLATFTHRNRDLLFATSPVAFERLHLACKGPCELVVGAFGAILLRYIIDAHELLCEPHGRVMSSGHLRRKHRLDLIGRLNSFD